MPCLCVTRCRYFIYYCHVFGMTRCQFCICQDVSFVFAVVKFLADMAVFFIFFCHFDVLARFLLYFIIVRMPFHADEK